MKNSTPPHPPWPGLGGGAHPVNPSLYPTLIRRNQEQLRKMQLYRSLAGIEPARVCVTDSPSPQGGDELQSWTKLVET
jgi:hypothetical protein